jgi:hypothetical protein
LPDEILWHVREVATPGSIASRDADSGDTRRPGVLYETSQGYNNSYPYYRIGVKL